MRDDAVVITISRPLAVRRESGANRVSSVGVTRQKDRIVVALLACGRGRLVQVGPYGLVPFTTISDLAARVETTAMAILGLLSRGRDD